MNGRKDYRVSWSSKQYIIACDHDQYFEIKYIGLENHYFHNKGKKVWFFDWGGRCRPRSGKADSKAASWSKKESCGLFGNGARRTF